MSKHPHKNSQSVEWVLERDTKKRLVLLLEQWQNTKSHGMRAEYGMRFW